MHVSARARLKTPQQTPVIPFPSKHIDLLRQLENQRTLIITDIHAAEQKIRSSVGTAQAVWGVLQGEMERFRTESAAALQELDSRLALLNQFHYIPRVRDQKQPSLFTAALADVLMILAVFALIGVAIFRNL